MAYSFADRLVCSAQAWALVLLPILLILVFAAHFNNPGAFFEFEYRYTPPPAEAQVKALVAAGDRRPILHDPHMMAYLGMPLFLLCAFALYALGRQVRPLASLLGVAVSATGAIYMGALFGTWTAFFAIGLVDPQYTEGAIASFGALTAQRGALLITTSLAKLSIFGLGLQAITLLGTRLVPNWSPIAATVGCGLFLAFWDLDNWMLIGTALILAGFIPMMRARLRMSQSEESASKE